jgi:type VI secretion system secreted protein Hcp
MPIYLKMDGVKGDVTHQGHEGWTDITSMSWQIGRQMKTNIGSTENREGSQPSMGEIILTKVTDGSSPVLSNEAATGRKAKTVQIHLVTTGSPGDTYLEYELTNCLIANYSMNSNGDRPNEVITLNFTKIQTKYIPSKSDNSASGPVVSSFDATTAIAS